MQAAMGEELKEELKVKDEEPEPKRQRVSATLILGEEIREPSYWDRLPYHITVQVYSYLESSDRRTMALVCRAWNNSFKDPSLWRSREFTLGGIYAQKRGRQVIRFASMFGSSLKSIVIRYHHRTDNTCKYITETMEKLMGKLKNARLCRLELADLFLERFVKFPNLKVTVTNCLVKMFQSQTALKRVVINKCQFPHEHGTDILKALQESCGQTLELLHLNDFYRTLGEVFQANMHLDIMTKFTNLREISVNYCYISDEMLQRWAVGLETKLQHIIIKVVCNEPHSHVISSRTWRSLTKACPRLTVVLSVHEISHADEIIPLLAPGMPLTGFHMSSGMESAHNSELPSTLTHLADNFDKKLESLNLIFPYLQDSVDNEVIRIVEKCRQLISMRVPATSALGVATAICNAFRERQVRNVRLQTGSHEGVPNGQPYQDIVRTFRDMLSNIPNLAVELVNEE